MRGNVLSFLFIVLINSSYSLIWKKGVVHYSINKLDYDVHSQEEITTTLAKLQEEICIKFFLHVGPGAVSNETKLLYISNPDKIKSCQPNTYNFEEAIVVMPIGYRCINSKAIARTVAEMLRASIEHTDEFDKFSVATVNSYDLIKKFQEKASDSSRSTLLSAVDRNFINAHYHNECGALTQRVLRRGGDDMRSALQLSAENLEYYEDKLWPLGIVMYGVEETLRGSKSYAILKYAMTSIELSTCIVFEELTENQVLSPKNFLWFGSKGNDTPFYGLQKGNQTINLEFMVNGAPGHTAHALNNLMRVLGVHMMSNRFDRDNYVSINWKNVQRGKEHLLEKAPNAAWLSQMSYDFDSVTHAPVNYACSGCELGGTTVQPLQDHLWQKTMSMGHRTALSDSDIQFLNILYGKQCQSRFLVEET